MVFIIRLLIDIKGKFKFGVTEYDSLALHAKTLFFDGAFIWVVDGLRK